jgi:hypothetical protein
LEKKKLETIGIGKKIRHKYKSNNFAHYQPFRRIYFEAEIIATNSLSRNRAPEVLNLARRMKIEFLS